MSQPAHVPLEGAAVADSVLAGLRRHVALRDLLASTPAASPEHPAFVHIPQRHSGYIRSNSTPAKVGGLCTWDTSICLVVVLHAVCGGTVHHVYLAHVDQQLASMPEVWPSDLSLFFKRSVKCDSVRYTIMHKANAQASALAEAAKKVIKQAHQRQKSSPPITFEVEEVTEEEDTIRVDRLGVITKQPVSNFPLMRHSHERHRSLVTKVGELCPSLSTAKSVMQYESPLRYDTAAWTSHPSDTTIPAHLVQVAQVLAHSTSSSGSATLTGSRHGSRHPTSRVHHSSSLSTSEA